MPFPQRLRGVTPRRMAPRDMSDAATPAKNDGPLLPVVAMVLSVVGLCFPPLLLITGALGLYGFLRARKEAAWAPRKQITQMTMAVSGAGIAVFTGLTLPLWKRFEAQRARQECSRTLAAIYEGERALYEKEARYSTKLFDVQPLAKRGAVVVRLAPEGQVWTAGTLGDQVGVGVDEQANPRLSTSTIDAAIPKLTLAELGIRGACPACSINIACAANIDADPSVDLWTISSLERKGAHGETIPAGLPWLELDDFSL